MRQLPSHCCLFAHLPLSVGSFKRRFGIQARRPGLLANLVSHAAQRLSKFSLQSLEAATTIARPSPFRIMASRQRSPQSQRWYFEMANVGNAKSSCESTHYDTASGGYPGFLNPSTQQLLVFLRKDNRPGFDQIAAILVDVKSGKLADQTDLGD